MIDLGAIWASAVAEMRVTRRLVRYWIFTALAFALFLIAYGYYALLHGAFSFFSATIAWLNPRFLLGAFGFWYCFVLMVGAVFLAFEVRGRDTRERISEVLDVRPITNLELLFGRMLGIVLMVWLPTFVISAVVYVIGVIVKAPIQPISLLSFIFVMTLPAFLFVIPLTFLVTLVVRVRLVAAVAVLALLGASVVTLFWTPIAWGTAFDISGSTALDLPSDVAPVIVREGGVIDRVAAVVGGIGLLLIAAGAHPRRDEGSRALRLQVGVAAVIACGAVLVWGGYDRVQDERQRQGWREAHDARRGEPAPDVTQLTASITLDAGRKIAWSAHLEAKAPNSASLSRALFTLNPGMAVSAVRVGGASASFTHEDGLLDIALPRPFAPGEAFTIEVEADGVPDENFAYVDAAKDPFSGTFQENQSLFILGQATLIFERGHVALLPGIAWLPLSGPYAATGDPSVRPDDRYMTRLEVDVPEDLLVAGPGARRDVAGAPSGMKRYLFDAKAPMPAPALVAGRFESRKATIDGVAVELLVDRKHTKNLEVFAPAAGAIEKKIAEKLERARAWGLTYPYDGFTLVEVPTRLRGYGGGWRMDSTFSPPAMVLMREAGFPTASFFRRFRDPKKWEDADGGVEGEMVRHLERFFSLDFTGGNLLMGASRAFGAHQIAGSGKDGLALEFVVDTLIAELVFETRGFFSAFLFDSDLNATIGQTIVGFLSSNQEESVTDIVLRTTADRPSVWDALLGTSLSAIDPASDPGRTVTVLNVKARALAQTMLQAYGRENTARALVELIRARRGQTFDRTHLNEALRSVGIEPGTLLSDWLDTTEIPGFVTSDATVTRLIDGPDGQARYQLLVHIHNAGSAVGVAVVKATARSEESRQSFSSDPVRVAAGESVEIGVTMSVPPTEVRLEPLFSQNRGPFSVRFSPVDEDAPRGTEEPLAGVRASEWRPRDDGSIVIDDLDPAFEPKATPVPTLLDSVRAMGARKKDDVERDLGLEVHPSFAPLTLQEWRRISAGSAWGRFRRTMAIAPAGTGEVEAIFRADVPSSGRYRIEIHVPSRQTLGPALQQMKYGAWTIKVDDGTGGEALRFDADAAIGGWNEVGVVPIKGGAVTVSYGNKLENGGQLLVADAIRLVPVTRAAGGTP